MCPPRFKPKERYTHRSFFRDAFYQIRNVEKHAIETESVLKGHPLFWKIVDKTSQARTICDAERDSVLGNKRYSKCENLIMEAEALAKELDFACDKYTEMMTEHVRFNKK